MGLPQSRLHTTVVEALPPKMMITPDTQVHLLGLKAFKRLFPGMYN